MIDLLTFQLDDLGNGRGPVLAVMAIVLAAIATVMLRDLFVWFEGLGRTADDAADDSDTVDGGLSDTSDTSDTDGQPALSVAPDAGPGLAPAFIDRRNVANPSTGFGRRKSDVVVNSQARAA